MYIYYTFSFDLAFSNLPTNILDLCWQDSPVVGPLLARLPPSIELTHKLPSSL